VTPTAPRTSIFHRFIARLCACHSLIKGYLISTGLCHAARRVGSSRFPNDHDTCSSTGYTYVWSVHGHRMLHSSVTQSLNMVGAVSAKLTNRRLDPFNLDGQTSTQHKGCTSENLKKKAGEPTRTRTNLTAFLITLTSCKDQRHAHLLPYLKKVFVAHAVCGGELLTEILKILYDASRYRRGVRRCRYSRRNFHSSLYHHHITLGSRHDCFCMPTGSRKFDEARC